MQMWTARDPSRNSPSFKVFQAIVKQNAVNFSLRSPESFSLPIAQGSSFIPLQCGTCTNPEAANATALKGLASAQTR